MRRFAHPIYWQKKKRVYWLDSTQTIITYEFGKSGIFTPDRSGFICVLRTAGRASPCMVERGEVGR